MCVYVLRRFSHVWLFATPWTLASQVPLTMGFSRQEYWSGLPCPPPGIFSTQGLNPHLMHCRQILYLLSCRGSPWHIAVPYTFLLIGCFAVWIRCLIHEKFKWQGNSVCWRQACCSNTGGLPGFGFSPVPSVNLASTETCLSSPLGAVSGLSVGFIVVKFIRLLYKGTTRSYKCTLRNSFHRGDDVHWHG